MVTVTPWQLHIHEHMLMPYHISVIITQFEQISQKQQLCTQMIINPGKMMKAIKWNLLMVCASVHL